MFRQFVRLSPSGRHTTRKFGLYVFTKEDAISITDSHTVCRPTIMNLNNACSKLSTYAIDLSVDF
jgi:hypothetical protein